MRTIDDLTNTDEPAWPLVRQWYTSSPRSVDVLPPSGPQALLDLQVTTRSVLGALAYECGGLVLDHGWLRVLGGGHPGLPPLANGDGHVVVAYDVLGGSFAINGGALPNVEAGRVGYFGPDTLDWMDLGSGHGAFVEWALTGDLTTFYRDLRWDGWEDETAALDLDQGMSITPPLWSREAQDDLAATSRRAAPYDEILAFRDDMARQLDGIDGPVKLRFAD